MSRPFMTLKITTN